MAIVERPDGCISIDGGPENENHTFLRDTRRVLGTAPTHLTTQSGIDNVLGCLGDETGTVDLVGHGFAGLIRTGCGMTSASCNNSNKVTSHNESAWLDAIRRLQSKATVIRLWGCHVGSTGAGAALVSRIHELTGATVMAPTVLIYWDEDRMREYPGRGPVSWIVADAIDPSPRIVPLELGAERAAVRVIRLLNRELIIEEIEAVAIEFASTPEKGTIWLDKDMARPLIASLGIDAFEANPGVPGAIVTHWIHVVTRNDTVTFGVFNDRYVFLKYAPRYFALVSQQFLGAATL